jgi:hypothetical protein
LRQTELVTSIGEMKNTYKILIGKPEGKRLLARSSSRWFHNIKMGLTGTGWEGVEWIDLAEDGDRRWVVVNTVMNRRFP